MKPKLALTIGAVAAAIFGLLLGLMPEQMLKGFGLATPPEAVVVMRDIGVTLLGLAVINWMARDASGPAVRAILVGNVVVQVLELAINGWEIATKALPSPAAPGLLIHAALAIVFLLGLRNAGAPMKTPAARTAAP